MESRERYISVSGLLRRLLAKWRVMLLTGILFALLAAGYKVSKTMKSSSEKAGLTEEQQLLVDSYNAELDAVEENLLRKNRYLEQSILVRINPAAAGRATVNLSVRTEEMDREGESGAVSAGSIMGAPGTSPNLSTLHTVSPGYRRAVQILAEYVNRAVWGTDWTGLEEELGTQGTYLNELISVDGEDDSIASVRLKVLYPDKEGAGRILSYVLQQLEEDYAEVEAIYGEHELVKGSQVVSTAVEKPLNTWMKDRLQEINDLSTQRDNFKKYMGTSQLLTEETGGVSMRSLIKPGIKYGIVGFAGGLILFVLIYALRLILSDLVLTGREVNRQYNLKKLAVVPAKETRGADALVEKIDGNYMSSHERNVSIRIAAENIRKAAGESGDFCKVALIGEPAKDILEDLLSALGTESGIELVTLSGLNRDPEALKKLDQCDGVVLVIRSMKTKYTDISDAIGTIEAYKKQILGSIVID